MIHSFKGEFIEVAAWYCVTRPLCKLDSKWCVVTRPWARAAARVCVCVCMCLYIYKGVKLARALAGRPIRALNGVIHLARGKRGCVTPSEV